MDQLLPGDRVHFDNPYYHKMTRKDQNGHPVTDGEQGSNVFMINKDHVIGIYNQKVWSVQDYQKHMLKDWATPQDRRYLRKKINGKTPSPDDFQIDRVLGPMSPQDIYDAVRKANRGG
jgi:hypothetical protein